MPTLTFLPHFNQVNFHQADQDSMLKVFLLPAFRCKTLRKFCDYKCRLFQNHIVYLPTPNSFCLIQITVSKATSWDGMDSGINPYFVLLSPCSFCILVISPALSSSHNVVYLTIWCSKPIPVYAHTHDVPWCFQGLELTHLLGFPSVYFMTY